MNGKKTQILMLPHSIINLELQRYFQNKPKFEVFIQKIICQGWGLHSKLSKVQIGNNALDSFVCKW